MRDENEIETKQISKNGFIDAVLLKIIVSLLVFLTPLALTFFVYLAQLETRVKILEVSANQQSEIVKEIRGDLKEIKNDINEIKIRIK